MGRLCWWNCCFLLIKCFNCFNLCGVWISNSSKTQLRRRMVFDLNLINDYSIICDIRRLRFLLN